MNSKNFNNKKSHACSNYKNFNKASPEFRSGRLAQIQTNLNGSFSFYKFKRFFKMESGSSSLNQISLFFITLTFWLGFPTQNILEQIHSLPNYKFLLNWKTIGHYNSFKSNSHLIIFTKYTMYMKIKFYVNLDNNFYLTINCFNSSNYFHNRVVAAYLQKVITTILNWSSRAPFILKIWNEIR